MREINVRTSAGTYVTVIGQNLDYGRLTLEKKPVHAVYNEGCHVIVISDDTVFGLYGSRTIESYRAAGFTVDSFVFPHGETSKTMKTVIDITEFLSNQKITRTDLIVALGGGVTGDIAGFVAAIYLRGIDVIQLPTTVLAAVDSSVGGKTGVDLVSGKNLVGAFHQPVAVFCDTDLFGSLPKQIFCDGMAEVIKYAVIRDIGLFEQLESADISDDMETICATCVTIKAEIVGQDEFDTGVRRLLNFGHTMGHGVETLSGYNISHGSAVAIGMMIVTKASEAVGLTEPGTVSRLEKVLRRLNLPVISPYSSEELIQVALSDKKRTGSVLHLVTAKQIGTAVITDLIITELYDFFIR